MRFRTAAAVLHTKWEVGRIHTPRIVIFDARLHVVSMSLELHFGDFCCSARQEASVHITAMARSMEEAKAVIADRDAEIQRYVYSRS